MMFGVAYSVAKSSSCPIAKRSTGQLTIGHLIELEIRSPFQSVWNRYVYATFVDEDGVVDDVEWLFSDSASDRIVQIHAASRAREQEDGGRNAARLEAIRAGLQWEQVTCSRPYFVSSRNIAPVVGVDVSFPALLRFSVCFYACPEL